MPTYLFHGTYTSEGFEGLLKEGGTSRESAFKSVIESVGGTMDSAYFSLGRQAYYVMAQMPNEVAAAAVTLTCNASGRVKISAELLVSPQQVDEVTKMRPAYRAPGK